MLYLSLEKVTFLNKSYLNILNSFEASKTRNKPFKPLLNSETRVRYFGFFSTFILFLFRASQSSSRYIKLDPSILDLFKAVQALYEEKLQEGDYLGSISKSLSKRRAALNLKLYRSQINRHSGVPSDEDLGEEGDKLASTSSLGQESSTLDPSISSGHSGKSLSTTLGSSSSPEESSTARILK
jgi:hypothetical protein